ncbi:hypothetical protein DXX93_03440 [Thalassotalea euphylliae]|uniref:MBL fold metallo-hydrolase n=1 Tax=Thalassotalea euphylliae TaxID=1655234 RepID=A0A3E0TN71_9GAMM|nr:hypothetical protein [Thalassotalea euphylliae]REL25700.1 hypothetical protein DXX93_03440 [Thalassotalea euphylliae]
MLHTGDLFFEGRFPYVDLKGGGSVDGYIANVNYMLKVFPDDVVIIPGHGEITDKAGLQQFANMMSDTSKQVKAQLKAGRTEAEILAAGVEDKYKTLSWRFITEERWLKNLLTDYQ